MTIQMTRDEYEKKFGMPPPVAPKSTVGTSSLKAPVASQGTQGLEGGAVGLAKSTLNFGRNIGSAVQSLGQRAIAAVSPTKTYQDIKSQTGISSIDNSTSEGSAVRDILTPRGTAEKAGNFAGEAAQFMVPASRVAKATASLPRLSKMGANVASDVGVTAAQQGNTESLATTGAVSAGLSSLPLVGKLIKGKTADIPAKMAQKLEEINLRLTPKQRTQLQKMQNSTIKFLSENKVAGTPEQRYEKIVGLIDKMENKVQSAIQSSGKRYSKEEIVSAIRNIPEDYLQTVDSPQVYNQMKRDVSAFIDFINSQKGDVIEAARLNSFKRNYAKEARNKAGDVVTNESRDALSKGLYLILQKDIKNLKSINKEYSKVLASEELLGAALGRKQIGFLGQIISSGAGGVVGGAVGGPFGSGIGMTAGPAIATKVAGTKMRSNVGAGLQTLSEYMKKARTTETGDFIIPRALIESLMSGEN